MALLTVKQAAEVLDLSEWSVYQLARQGRLPCVHVGRSVKFRQDDLDAWAAAGGTKAPIRSVSNVVPMPRQGVGS